MQVIRGYVPSRPARQFSRAGDCQSPVTPARPSGLRYSVFHRWTACFVDPAEHCEVNIILDATRLDEHGYVLREFKAWGGWCAYQYEALMELINKRPRWSTFRGDLYIALLDRSAYNHPTIKV